MKQKVLSGTYSETSEVSKPGIGLKRQILKNKWMYVMLIPIAVYFFIFSYIPIYGLLMSFQDFDPIKGYFGSEWVGLKHFKILIESNEFWNVFKNSLLLSFYRLLWGFPIPIIVSVMLNEVRCSLYKRTLQTIMYFPHFISWVIVMGMVTNFLSPTTGIVNQILVALGHEPIAFLTKSSAFRTIIVASEIWKDTGWSTVMYLAALTAIDPGLYEAAYIDGASRMKRIFYVTLPGISGTITLLFIMRLGSILNNGFEQVLMIYNPMIYDVADVFETYTYRTGLLEGRYSYSSAIGLFKSVVGCVLMLWANHISIKVQKIGLW